MTLDPSATCAARAQAALLLERIQCLNPRSRTELYNMAQSDVTAACTALVAVGMLVKDPDR